MCELLDPQIHCGRIHVDHNKADTLAQPTSGGANLKVFSLNTNQYRGDFVVHFKDPESRLRPYLLLGAGATYIAPDRSQENSTTRFAWYSAPA